MYRPPVVPSVTVMEKFTFVLGFLPWIVFSFVAQRLDANGVAWSATIAVAMTLVALVVARRRHGPKILNLGSLVLFAVIAVVGFVGGPAIDLWLFEWGRPLVGVILGLYVLATVPIMPFTEEYARQSVPRQYWGSPTFRRINRVLSAAWGAAIVVIGVSGLLVTVLDAHAVDASRNNVVDLLLNWVVPIAVIWAMVKFTATYPDRVTGPTGSQAGGVRPAGGATA
jgi:NO-binding membrane sensor protein with MHYT domain